MNKGIVMEIVGNQYVVLTREGEFTRIKKVDNAVQIGDEVPILNSSLFIRRSSTRYIVGLGALAAIFAMIFLFANVLMPSHTQEVVAYVTLDVNPSLELGINKQQKVIRVVGLNEAGNTLLSDLDLQGKKIEHAAMMIVRQAEETVLQNNVDGEILITSVLMDRKAKLDTQIMNEQIKIRVLEEISKNVSTQAKSGSTITKVTTMSIPAEIREEAELAGVSSGKMAMYLAAKSQGIVMSIEELKNSSIHNLSKQWSELVDVEFKPANIDYILLVEQERAGELDEKIRMIEDEKEQRERQELQEKLKQEQEQESLKWNPQFYVEEVKPVETVQRSQEKDRLKPKIEREEKPTTQPKQPKKLESEIKLDQIEPTKKDTNVKPDQAKHEKSNKLQEKEKLKEVPDESKPILPSKDWGKREDFKPKEFLQLEEGFKELQTELDQIHKELKQTVDDELQKVTDFIQDELDVNQMIDEVFNNLQDTEKLLQEGLKNSLQDIETELKKELNGLIPELDLKLDLGELEKGLLNPIGDLFKNR